MRNDGAQDVLDSSRRAESCEGLLGSGERGWESREQQGVRMDTSRFDRLR